MYFLIVAKPGTRVGPFYLGGRVFVIPLNYYGVDRLSLPIAGQLRDIGHTDGLIAPNSGIGLEVFTSFSAAERARDALPERGSVPPDAVPRDEAASEALQTEIYHRDDVEIICLRGSEFEEHYGQVSNVSGDNPIVKWIGYDIYEEGDWSLVRGAIDAGQADELQKTPGFLPDVGLFQSRNAAASFIQRYAALARLFKVEPTASMEDPSAMLAPSATQRRFSILPIEVGIVFVGG